MRRKTIYRILEKREKKHNITLPSNYKDIIKEYESLCDLKGNRVEWYDRKAKKLNANATFKGVILINVQYWYCIVTENSPLIKNMFIETIGHELTHKEYELPRVFVRGRNNRKFCNWINEVYADFCGSKLLKEHGGTFEDVVDVFTEKLNRSGIETDSIHPDWKTRKRYIQTRSFDHSLIMKIAEETNCTNSSLIKMAETFPTVKI